MANNTNNGSAFFASKLSSGFKLLDSAEKSGNKGVQTLAFSAMIGRKQLMENGKKVASWASFISSSEAVNQLATELLDYADIIAPVADKSGKDELFLARDKAFKAQKQAMRRAIMLAAELQASGLDENTFQEKNGVFAVNPIDLCEYGHDLTGKLSRMEKEGKPVPLDGSAYMVETPESKVKPVNASVSQFLKAAKSVREGASTTKAGSASVGTEPTDGSIQNKPEGTNGGQGTAASNKNKWDAVDFDGGVKAIAAIIRDGGDGEPLKWSDLSEKTRSNLEEIRMFIEQCKAHEVMTPDTKKKVA